MPLTERPLVTTQGLAAQKRRTGRHRTARRPSRPLRLAGVAAALATAGAVGVTPGAVSATTTHGPKSLDQAGIDSMSFARVERQRLTSRDSIRVGLNPVNKKLQQATAAKQAKARAARITELQTQARQRAAALAAAKKLAAAKRAAQIAARKKALEAAKPRVKLMVSGYHITATFGQGGGRWASGHTGLDFAAPIGTRIGAVMAGEVISAEFAGAFGRRVEVRHANGTVTWYCHMSEFTVSVGDHVDAGDQVGAVGMTGNTTGPHLHFEVHPGGGDAIDPMPWLRAQGLNP
jgi:murein DD-endopeptidase MepM/ murein hydrolase activator NlpD